MLKGEEIHKRAKICDILWSRTTPAQSKNLCLLWTLFFSKEMKDLWTWWVVLSNLLCFFPSVRHQHYFCEQFSRLPSQFWLKPWVRSPRQKNMTILFCSWFIFQFDLNKAAFPPLETNAFFLQFAFSLHKKGCPWAKFDIWEHFKSGFVQVDKIALQFSLRWILGQFCRHCVAFVVSFCIVKTSKNVTVRQNLLPNANKM